MWNSCNDLVFQRVKGLSSSVRENICLHVLEMGSVYFIYCMLNQSLVEALGRASNPLSILVCVRCVGMETFWSGRIRRLLFLFKKNPQRLKWRTFDLRSVMPPCWFSLCSCRSFFSPIFLCSLCAKYG